MVFIDRPLRVWDRKLMQNFPITIGVFWGDTLFIKQIWNHGELRMISVVIVNFSRALRDNPASKKAIKNIKKAQLAQKAQFPQEAQFPQQAHFPQQSHL